MFTLLQKFTNIVMPGATYSPPVETASDSDSSSEDWEDSIDSSEIDMTATDSDEDEDEVFIEYFPKLTKYLVTY